MFVRIELQHVEAHMRWQAFLASTRMWTFLLRTAAKAMFASTVLHGTARQYRVTLTLVLFDAAFYSAEEVQSGEHGLPSVIPPEAQVQVLPSMEHGLNDKAGGLADKPLLQSPLRLIPWSRLAVLQAAIDVGIHWFGVSPVGVFFFAAACKGGGEPSN